MGRVTDSLRKQSVPHRSPRTSGSTKKAILDSAEALLADDDVSNVTMRSIAEAAGIDPASVTYHFGGKTELVAAVMRRRYTALRELQMSALTRLLAEATEIPTARQLLDTVYRPWFELVGSGDQGWRSYSRLVAGTLNDGILADLIEDHAVQWREALVAALCRACPGADAKTVMQALALTFGAALPFVAPPVASTAGGPDAPIVSDLDYERFLHFVSSGFESMVSWPIG